MPGIPSHARIRSWSRWKLLAAGGLILAAAVMVRPAPASADVDEPSAEEMQRIEKALKRSGFKTWGDVESEDNGRLWKVEDALAADGNTYTILLSAGNVRVLLRTPEG
ncbi:MAG: PepSY domain-containing protein [Acetobacteraceae bacterium]